jgi:hypothetical protein
MYNVPGNSIMVYYNELPHVSIYKALFSKSHTNDNSHGKKHAWTIYFSSIMWITLPNYSRSVYKKDVKQPHYRPGWPHRVPGG